MMKTRNRLLAMLGLVSLVAYVLACRPAFSPDGRKILFPVFGDQQTAIALYDRDSGKSGIVFQVPKKSGEGLRVESAIWTPDGNQALIYGNYESGQMVMSLPLGSRHPASLYLLPSTNAQKDEVLLEPPVLLGQNVFIGGKGVTRLNLESGEIKKEYLKEGEDVVILMGQKDKCYWLRQAGKTFSVGLLDPDSLKMETLLSFPEGKGLETIYPVAPSLDGTRLAIRLKEEEKQEIRLYRGQNLERTISLESPKKLEVTSLQWSKDGKTLYGLAFRPEEQGDKKHCRCELWEFPVDGGTARSAVLFVLPESDAEGLVSCLLALSPDGKTLAFSTAAAIKDSEPVDPALYLVDLTKSKRPVKKIPAPQLGPKDAKDRPPKP